MKRGKTSRRPEPAIFEINLISDRVHRLRRRRTFSRFGDVAAITMTALALVFCLVTAFNLITIMRAKSGLRKLRAELAEEQKTAEQLDHMRDKIVGSIGKWKSFVPVAKRRVRWAQKLSALARALPRGMGVTRVSVKAIDFLTDEEQAKARKMHETFGSRYIPEAHLLFSLVYLPPSGKRRDVMGELRDNLLESNAFMEKMQLVRIEKHAVETRKNTQVQVFEGLLKGIEESQRQ